MESEDVTVVGLSFAGMVVASIVALWWCLGRAAPAPLPVSPPPPVVVGPRPPNPMPYKPPLLFPDERHELNRPGVEHMIVADELARQADPSLRAGWQSMNRSEQEDAVATMMAVTAFEKQVGRLATDAEILEIHRQVKQRSQ